MSSLPIHILLILISLKFPDNNHPLLSITKIATFFTQFTVTISTTFTITNNCADTIWPAILSGAGTSPLPTTSFSLSSGESRAIPIPPSWSGRLWARTLCSADNSCATGATPPATLAEFTLAGSGGLDFFDVSLVDGYNLPMLIVPTGGGGGKCSATGCAVDLNRICPTELRVTDGEKGVACRSACGAFGGAEYCCSGEYGSAGTCRPTAFSEFFKNACPRAYSFAYDDESSTFTCEIGTDYEISFCPGKISQKAGENILEAGVPLINDTMTFMGVVNASNALAAHTWQLISATFIVFLLLLFFSR